MSRPRIVVGGAVARKPGAAGHAWQFLQYLLGFRALGYDVLLLDRLEGTPQRQAAGVDWVRRVLGGAGLHDAWSVDLGGGVHAGVTRRRALDFLAGADLLLNVMGYVEDAALLAAARRRVFLDTDPGFPQMWRALGLADVLGGHDAHVTIAERLGEPDCTIPHCGLNWITTSQPVVLDEGPRALPGPGLRFTSVATWRGAYGPVEYEGRTYGLRVHEMRRFASLPRLAGGAFEVALDIDDADAEDAALLRDGGWELVAPGAVAATPGAYRRYVQGSDAELTIAKGVYVATRGGWLSERSLCYLASGRPVLAQDTGFSRCHPTGEGLIAFATVEEALAGVAAIRSRPRVHACAARELARERFASDRVLPRLLDRVGAVAA